MPIDFSPGRWDGIKDIYGQFWSKSLERPILGAEIYGGKDPGRDKPDVMLLSQETCADLSIPPEKIIDRIDYELSCVEFIGDVFPYMGFECFGPGVLTAFLGAVLDNSSSKVWFYPPEDLPIQELHFEYDADNVWFNRIKDIYKAGMDRWQGQVMMGLPDLGGNLDLLSVFRPGEKLIFDLIDYPDEVKRVLMELHRLWHRYYQELTDFLSPGNMGNTNWSRIYSQEKSYILQSDFSYMISTDMYEEFAYDELALTMKKIKNTVYHLDGKGQLAHLDVLLANPDLTGIQWVPGEGEPSQDMWPEVYRKIEPTDKMLHLYCGLDGMDTIAEIMGGYNRICHMPIRVAPDGREQIIKRFGAYGVL